MSQTKNIFRFFTSFLSPVKVEERKEAVTPRLEIYLSNGRYILDSALAKKYFHIDRYKNLSLHIEDAGDFVENCDKKFDLVVGDIFVGADVPEKFREEKFLAGLRRLLSPGGISFFNTRSLGSQGSFH